MANTTLNSKHLIDQQRSPKHIVIVTYHEDDRALFERLLPHLDMLTRSSNQLWLIYRYPLSHYESAKDLREMHLEQLEAATLFIPLTSAKLVNELWRQIQASPRMAAALAHISVIPIALRSAAHVQALRQKPLEESPIGPECEQACVELVQDLEGKLRKICGDPQDQSDDPRAILFSTVQMHFSLPE